MPSYFIPLQDCGGLFTKVSWCIKGVRTRQSAHLITPLKASLTICCPKMRQSAYSSPPVGLRCTGRHGLAFHYGPAHLILDLIVELMGFYMSVIGLSEV
jgi:hypothetical protein